MSGRAVGSTLALAVAACAVTTGYDYPGDLASGNYLKRTHAAREFARTRDAAAAPAAFPLLNDEHVTLRALVHRALRDLSGGEDFGYRPDLDEPDRERLARRWQLWWEQGGSERGRG